LSAKATLYLLNTQIKCCFSRQD